MFDTGIIIALLATLIAGALIGAVGVLSLIAAALHRTANVSAFIAPAGTRATVRVDELVDAAEALDAHREAEIERSFRLDGGYGPSSASPTGKIAPERSSRVVDRAPGCGWCLGLRKAIFGKK